MFLCTYLALLSLPLIILLICVYSSGFLGWWLSHPQLLDWLLKGGWWRGKMLNNQISILWKSKHLQTPFGSDSLISMWVCVCVCLSVCINNIEGRMMLLFSPSGSFKSSSQHLWQNKVGYWLPSSDYYVMEYVAWLREGERWNTWDWAGVGTGPTFFASLMEDEEQETRALSQ